MKRIYLLSISLLIFAMAFGQNKTKQEPICELADIRFQDNKIVYYYYDIPAFRLRPVLQIKGLFRAKVYHTPPPVKVSKDIYQNLQKELDNFDKSSAGFPDKERYLRTATLQLLWASMKKTEFRAATLSILQDFTQDSDKSIAGFAHSVILLYERLQKHEFTRFDLVE